MDNNRPSWHFRILRLFCKPEYLEEIEGDLLERFEKRPSSWILAIEVIKLFRRTVIKDMGGSEASESLEAAFRTYNNPDRAYWVRFVDDIFNAKYRSELLVKKVSWYFTFVSIAISILGLVSLVACNVERKTKEVGIRKILGASVSSIFGLLSLEYVRLLTIAAFVAFPIGYFIISDWLDGFVYRISLDWKLFVLSSCCSLISALFIIGFLTRKVATANPVDSLRDE